MVCVDADDAANATQHPIDFHALVVAWFGNA